MKNTLLLSFLILLASCSENRPEMELPDGQVNIKQLQLSEGYDALSANNQISSIQKGAVSIVDSVFKSDTVFMEKRRVDAIFDFEISMSRLHSLGNEHEVANYFSQSVIKLLKFYKVEFENDFKKIVPILRQSKLSENDRQIINLYDQEFAKEEGLLFSEILICQDSFANYFDISFRE